MRLVYQLSPLHRVCEVRQSELTALALHYGEDLHFLDDKHLMMYPNTKKQKQTVETIHVRPVVRQISRLRQCHKEKGKQSSRHYLMSLKPSKLSGSK